MEYLIVGLIVVILVLGYLVMRAMATIDSLDTFNDKLVSDNIELHSKFAETLSIMRAIDSRGYFEADDEVGIVFQGLKDALEIVKFKEPYYLADSAGTEEQ